ncbi:MAG TPA: NAD-dependent epimerase/dehydratase family protein [Thermoleophilaceae bacterium]|jgi:nucleoside-diphosphate-sugar epimerase|nr:NAD-dependent epimerase/dehydratase family protein [Thermoleophilaceae bacterium]
MGLTVAVTGPTGDIGRAFLRDLDDSPEVDRIIGMARRPFDPGTFGLEKTEYRQGDILDKDSLGDLVDGADVLVHLAFIILGGREETHRINLEGTRNVFEAANSADLKRFVYTSSVAAYGFHDDNPQPLTEEVVPKGTNEFYYSSQKAELERELHRMADGSDVDTYVFRPCIVAGQDALTLISAMMEQLQLGGRLPQITTFLTSVPILKPVLPDPGTLFQLVHHDDVAQALTAAVTGRGEPGIYNLAGEGTISFGDLASALGWYSVPVPNFAIDVTAEVIARIPFAPAQLSWIHAARVPVVMETQKAREKLGWEPHYDTRETLAETIVGAREEGLI